MRSQTRCTIGVLLFSATVFVETVCAIARETADAVPSIDQLPAACRKAGAEFRPLAQDDLREVKANLIEAVDRLDRRLTAAGNNGEAWRTYLKWDLWQGRLQSDEPLDPEMVKRLFRLYNARHEGLHLCWFLDVKEALWRYDWAARAIADPELPDDYGRFMDELAELLETYAKRPTPEDAKTISDWIRWLEGVRQAPSLRAAVRHHYGHPNLLLDVSARTVAAALAEPIDETGPIRDVILGTDIYGTGRTTGEINAQLSPHENQGAVDTLFRGTNISRNIGYNGPVRVYTDGNTQLEASKRMLIGPTGLSVSPTTSMARAEATITAIRSRRGCELVEKMAWRRAGKQKAEANWIASRHAEQRLNRQMDRRTAEMIEPANKAWVEKVRKPLLDRKLFPRQLDIHTSETALRVVALQANASQLGASSPPPKLPDRYDLALRLHESTVNNLAAAVLTNATLRDEKVRSVAAEFLGDVPETLKQSKDQDPWAIAFSSEQPVSVTFADDGFTLTIRGRDFYQGERRHPGMNVTAVYKIEPLPNGFQAIRQGNLLIRPPDFKPGDRLSAAQTAAGPILRRRFGKVFSRELVFDGFTLSGKLQRIGTMRPVLMTCRDGWLTIAFNAQQQ